MTDKAISGTLRNFVCEAIVMEKGIDTLSRWPEGAGAGSFGA